MAELLALCDRLEGAQAERESRRDRLAAASLQRLDQPDADVSLFRAAAGASSSDIGVGTRVVRRRGLRL